MRHKTLRNRTFLPLAALALALTTFPATPVEAQQGLTYEQARTAMDAAEAEARRNEWNLTILIADADGVPIYLRRMTGASARTHEIASGKVRTVLATGMPSGEYGQAVAAGRIEAIPDGITFEGGYPIRLGGALVGAMSASGARGSEDAQVVRAGLAAIGVTP
jgi:glc operon protein GlcG